MHHSTDAFDEINRIKRLVSIITTRIIAKDTRELFAQAGGDLNRLEAIFEQIEAEVTTSSAYPAAQYKSVELSIKNDNEAESSSPIRWPVSTLQSNSFRSGQISLFVSMRNGA
ncbi:MAG: hypothetical protein GOMPHAMPRED_004693 [Gomphillus americanus]|uniref:Uncharacterized protein n=1 Tax=Gomphillus americanus TaxID=1940652 RepID=A0A8H3EIK4_9LECA|nr:MAG: hypothetical protein GOMPHAMPRED_004693 [Gomphillus americanus]